MSCSCAHHHTPAQDLTGTAVPLSPAPLAVHGRLICRDAAQMMLALELLPDHAAASRAERGCLRFEVAQSDDPMVFTLSEVFVDEAAFAAHQERTAASPWGRRSGQIGRDVHRHPAQVLIRPETSSDHAAVDALLSRAFDGPSEARLLRELRADEDLAQSLVAHVEGVVVGHVALSPLRADATALALAPLAVHPALQRRGLGQSLTRAAVAAADGPVVVLGDPAFYGRLDFEPADLASPYAGPALQIHGILPAGSRVEHAPAFARL